MRRHDGNDNNNINNTNIDDNNNDERRIQCNVNARNVDRYVDVERHKIWTRTAGGKDYRKNECHQFDQSPGGKGGSLPSGQRDLSRTKPVRMGPLPHQHGCVHRAGPPLRHFARNRQRILRKVRKKLKIGVIVTISK